MIPAPFDYDVAESVDHAVELLGQGDGDAKALAGGQSLIPALRLRIARPAKLVDLGERMILPHVDSERMTRLAMGAIWALATPDQRQRLAREFATLLVRGYSAALASYTDQLMIVSRVRAEPRDSEVAVKFEINQPEARPMAIDYSLARTASGWRVYDIRIGGASLATAYGPAFSEEARHYGIEGLISLLSIRNQERAADAAGPFGSRKRPVRVGQDLTCRTV